MNKQELINKLHEVTGFSKKDSEKFLTSFTEVIEDTVAIGEDVSLTGFGKFSKQEVKGREGVSKLQGVEKAWKTEDSHMPKFSAGKLFKDKVKGLV